MTLDIEHLAKVRLMREVTERADEDGYSIVADYLESLSERNLSIREKEMERLKRDRYSGGMARKYDEEKPVWVLIELLSFGGFINFYLFCTDRWKDRRMRSEHYLLRQAQAVRNACAHDLCANAHKLCYRRLSVMSSLSRLTGSEACTT